MNNDASPSQTFLLIGVDSAFADTLACAFSHQPEWTIRGPVPPSLAVESARASLDSPLLIDLDSLEPAEALRLVAKLTLITRSPILVTSSSAIDASASMDALFQTGASAVLLKPQGRASLSLAGVSGLSFVQSLRAALKEASPVVTHDPA